MTASERIERYLGGFRDRLIRLSTWRGAAAMAVAALGITLLTVTLAIRSGFPADLMLIARLVLLGSLLALFVICIRRPRSRLEADASNDVETRAPAFAGRVATWTGMPAANNPMRELLAEDALRIAERNPPESAVPQKEFSLPQLLAGVSAAALLLLATAGPGNYAYGVRHLWVGWAFPGVLPPQSLAVTPGDDGIRSGGTVRVKATANGFSPGEAFVHARFGDDDWQRVSMAELESTFEFTFFSVREPLEYYVSAANVRSPTYSINVVDLPNIDQLITTYRFPEWTRREPEVRDPGGDIRTIAETQVDIEIRSPDALTPGVLIVDDTEYPLDVDGSTGKATFTVAEDGQYYLAAVVGGERIRLTDDYFISVQEDAIPSIEFARPGRDWSASSIEEVTAQIIATDDFFVESLELRYSVNGGDWQSVELPGGQQEVDQSHVFFLESLLAEQDPPGTLVPGDLISYYALARDRNSSARTDIFFVDVQPFDRRYSQSQMSGGGGQGGGQQQDEISRRQREIIVSTWNLIREAQENRRNDDSYVPNNAALLSRLQGTLKEQAETLAERTRARQLAASDEKIAEFVDNLDKAAAAMLPASARLADIELEEAILPEQEALQHLLRAEAVFTDISVSMQANNRGGGGGGRAGRDLTDMFELEMDLEKNQYETGSQATPEAPEEQLDEIGDELEELARRQEQLANRMQREQTPTPAERWQQDMLRRDVEELRERLEQMQQAANQQQGQQQSSGQSSGGQPQSASQNGSEDSSGQGSEAQAANEQQRQAERLKRRLDSAVRAMNEAEQAMRQGTDREALQRAAAEAQRQLEGARDQASAESERLTQASLNALGERADDIFDRQADIEERLQEAIRKVLENDANDDRLDSGMSFQEEYAMAEEKRRLQADLQRLEQSVRSTARSLNETQPRASEALQAGLEQLREDEVDARIAISASYIEDGQAVYISASESAITDALRRFSDAMERAAEAADSGRGNAQNAANERGIEQTLADTQALRRQLQQLTDQVNRANQQSAQRRDGNDNPNDGNPGNANQQQAAGNEQAGGSPSGPLLTSGRDDRQRSTGVRVGDLEITRELNRGFEQVSDDVLNRFRELREAGVAEQTLDDLRRLAREVRASDFSGNEDILARESRLALNLVEQLELALTDAVQSGRESVRSNPVDLVPDEHRKPVANYYRRLGADGSDEQ